MFIRTNTNIYEVEDKKYENNKLIGYFVGDMDFIKAEQVIGKETEDLEDLCDNFSLIVDGKILHSSDDLLTVESYAIKHEFEKVRIYGMIWSVDRFGNIKTKVVAKHSVDENGHGYYGLVKEHIINLWNKKED